MRVFVQLRLLLHLVRRPAHGYELIDALGAQSDEPTPEDFTSMRQGQGNIIHPGLYKG